MRYEQNKQGKATWEVADIFHLYGDTYRQKHNLPADHHKVMKAIMTCRTEFLGGHLQQCDTCGFQRLVFHSCRNRHCPKCQTSVKARWLKAREEELLPLSYFHMVFTLPHELNPIALCNKKEIATLLFRAVSQTLLEFGKSPVNGLKGEIGFISILHTWDQKLLDHFHIHCLIPAGALSSDYSEWIHPKRNYLFSVQTLSRVFRGKFIDFLTQAYEKERLIFPGKTGYWGTDDGLKALLRSLWKKEWVVYCKAALEPKQVLRYLSQYVHRVAIANHRIIDVSDGKVTFTHKDRKNNTTEELTIDAVEFIRRFFLHVLPRNFMRIRAYGFLSNRSKKKKLQRCRELLGLKQQPPSTKKSIVEILNDIFGIDITKCSECKTGTLLNIKEIQPLINTNTYTLDEVFTMSVTRDTS